MRLAWEVTHYSEPHLARVQASTMHELPCGCDRHFTAVPIDLLESYPEMLGEVVAEFERLHKDMDGRCPRND